MGQVLELLCLQPPIPNIIHSDRTLTHETGMLCERLSPLQDTTCRHMTWDGPQHHTKRLPWPSLQVVLRTSILWWGLMVLSLWASGDTALCIIIKTSTKQQFSAIFNCNKYASLAKVELRPRRRFSTGINPASLRWVGRG